MKLLEQGGGILSSMVRIYIKRRNFNHRHYEEIE